MPTPRTIAAVTSSRADYGHLFWPLRELEARSNVRLQLYVTGAHLAPEFGHTVDEIERDGFEITGRIESLLSSDTDVGMAKTIGLATIGFADAWGHDRPDLLLLIADRYEMLAPASAALALRLPIAHIEGGEVSEGAIDHAVRNALTMMSHVHLTPTRAAADRVRAMGEEPWRVHQVGAPSLDHLRRTSLPTKHDLEEQLGLTLDVPPVVVAYHPVTLERETTREVEAVFSALTSIERPIIFCFPNADAGSRRIIAMAESFCEARAAAHLYVNLNHLMYWRLLSEAALLFGNSSSGIMETPSLALPAVNIGRRQEGRERAINIIDCPADADAITDAVQRALDPTFRASLEGMTNPYGDGHAGEKIAEILASVAIDGRLLNKRAMPVGELV